MIAILKQILYLLEAFIEERRREQLELKLAAQKEIWLDSTTTMFMLRVGDRQLYNYVRSGKLISRKRGAANTYLESSVLSLMNK